MTEEKVKCPFCAIIEDYVSANVKYEDDYVIGLESEASQSGRALLQEVLFVPKDHRKLLTLRGENKLFEAIEAFLTRSGICAYKVIWSTGHCVEGHSFVMVRFPFVYELQSVIR